MNAIIETVPAIAEAVTPAGVAMTVADVVGEITRLKNALGGKADITVYVGPRYDGSYVSVTVWPNGMSGAGRPEYMNGKDWPEAFANAHVWAEKMKVERRETIVRRLAIAIIDLTDQNGAATDVALSRHGFSADEIREFHEPACFRASNMAALRPFAVVFG